MFTWDELERKYNMKLKQPPLRLSGGLMHKMYKLETDQGIYALKLLNPFIMQREDAMENYRAAGIHTGAKKHSDSSSIVCIRK